MTPPRAGKISTSTGHHGPNDFKAHNWPPPPSGSLFSTPTSCVEKPSQTLSFNLVRPLVFSSSPHLSSRSVRSLVLSRPLVKSRPFPCPVPSSILVQFRAFPCPRPLPSLRQVSTKATSRTIASRKVASTAAWRAAALTKAFRSRILGKLCDHSPSKFLFAKPYLFSFFLSAKGVPLQAAKSS